MTETPQIEQSRESAVKRWCTRVRAAREHWAPDFDRMRENMEFAASIQWPAQDGVDSEQYVANLALRTLNQKTAALYAKNPQAVAFSRKRRDFQLWDGKVESLVVAAQQVEADPLSQMPGTVEANALLQDYQTGKQTRDMVNDVGETLTILYQWMIDQQEPEFKLQMKQLVRRVITTGVAYVRLGFERDVPGTFTTSTTNEQTVLRARQAALILQKLADGDITPDDEQLDTLKTLVTGLQGQQQDGEAEERLVFDFPPATSIIPDPACRTIKGFVGARWIAQEFILPLDEVNEFFETNIEVGGDLKTYDDEGQENISGDDAKDDPAVTPRVCVWEIFDKKTKTHSFVCDGWKDYLLAPEPLSPSIHRFWPLFALTFNDVETEPGCKAPVFPPSDIQLIKHPQMEHNRSRESLRQHRIANKPVYLTGKGWLSNTDKQSIMGAKSHQVVELEGAKPGDDIGKLLAPFAHAPLDPQLYDTGPAQQDVLLTVGMQEANLGPLSGATATEAGIAEQSRSTVSSSNVDDLDDFLSDLAKSGGEMLLKGCSPNFVRRVVGEGAVWPQTNSIDFVNETFLQIVAASSGRPNKAMEISNFRQLAPVLLQAGANPQYIVREAAKRLDDRANVEDAFPITPQRPQQQQLMAMQPQQVAQESEVPTQGNVPQ